MELIDKKEVIDILCRLHMDNIAVNGKRITEFIKEIPTVEAKEVVHGEWIDGCCSNCGAYIPTDSLWDYISEKDCKFCYECGARMAKDNE